MEEAKPDKNGHEKARSPSKGYHLLVIEVSVYCRPELGLVGLVVELEHFPVVFLVRPVRSLRTVVVVALAIHHLNLVVEQTHGLYLILQLEPGVSVLKLFGL